MDTELIFSNGVGAAMLIIAFRFVWRLWQERITLTDQASSEKNAAVTELNAVKAELADERSKRVALEVEVRYLREQVTTLQAEIKEMREWHNE